MAARIQSIILKLASLCNLNCSYCYVYNHEDRSFRDRPKFLLDSVLERSLSIVKSYCDHHEGHKMSLVFHGGEPTLVGPDRFNQIASRSRQVLGSALDCMMLQTNATLIDQRWIDVLAHHRVSVGVSLDGPPDIHDSVRVFHDGRGSASKTLDGLALLLSAGLDPGILCVVNPGRSGLEAYRFFRSLGIKRMNFLLPDTSHDNKGRIYGTCEPTPVADYLIPIFDEWFETDDADIKIRLFWGLIRTLMGGVGETDVFGNPLMSYVVVETDGSIEALDALRVCKAGLARSGLNVLQNDLNDLHLGLPIVHRLVHEGIPLPTTCQRCNDRAICGGGYLPHRYSRKNGFDNPSVWCADIMKLLDHMRGRLMEAGIALL